MSRFIFTGLIVSLLVTTTARAQAEDNVGYRTGVIVGAATGGVVCETTTSCELVRMLDETKSIDTYVAILSLLQPKDAKHAVPALIRNAERLGIFDNVLLNPQQDDRKSKLAEMVMEQIAKLTIESKKTASQTPAVAQPVGGEEESSTPTLKRFPFSELPKRSRVVIYTTFDKDPGEEWVRKQQRDLAYLLRKQLQQVNADVTIVPINKVESLRMKEEEDPTVDTMISRLKADYVVRLNVHKLGYVSENKAGEQAMVQGKIALKLSVIDGRDPNEDPLFEEEFLATGPQQMFHSSEEWKAPAFAREFLQSVSEKLAERFGVFQPARVEYDKIEGGLR